jgi:hypothetical protein
LLSPPPPPPCFFLVGRYPRAVPTICAVEIQGMLSF